MSDMVSKTNDGNEAMFLNFCSFTHEEIIRLAKGTVTDRNASLIPASKVTKNDVYSSLNFGKATGYIFVGAMAGTHLAIAYTLWAVQKWWWESVPHWTIFAVAIGLAVNYFFSAFVLHRTTFKVKPQENAIHYERLMNSEADGL